MLSLLTRSRNCYKVHNSQRKNKPSPGKAQLFLLMRPERRSSRVSSAILEYIRINWNWNDSLSELLVISQSTPSPRTKTETSQGPFLAWSLLDLEKEERILGISLPQPTSGESQDASWYKHRCPFTWPRNHLPPL